MKKIISALAFFICIGFSFAEYNKAGLPDSAEIRRRVVDSWLTAGIDRLRTKNPELHENDAREIFQIRMEEGVDNVSIIVAPQTFLDVDVVRDGSNSTLRMAVYPEGNPGSWILQRDKKTGRGVKINWYFNSDAAVYVQFYPEGNKTYADMIVYNSYLARSIPVGVPFAKLYTSSFGDIQRWTEKTLPWEKVKVIPGQYLDSIHMVNVIREKIPLIDYAENACYNENGELYSLLTNTRFTVKDENGDDVFPQNNGRLTLSGAGFAKWIIDGLVRPLTGKGTDIASLEQPTVEFDPVGKNGIISQENSLTFHLDWVRNLSAYVMNKKNRHNLSYKECGVDVNIRPFFSEIQNGKNVNSSGYIADTGYEIRRIKSLLYVLAATEPSWFYLGAVKRFSKIKRDEFVFDTTVVLFPYFDDTGRFGCVIFDHNNEVSLDEFILDNSDCYIHLERVKATEIFFPDNR